MDAIREALAQRVVELELHVERLEAELAAERAGIDAEIDKAETHIDLLRDME